MNLFKKQSVPFWHIIQHDANIMNMSVWCNCSLLSLPKPLLTHSSFQWHMNRGQAAEKAESRLTFLTMRALPIWFPW